jgi:hypothetical protein
MAMKYIRLKTGPIIIFSESINHSEMAQYFGGKENVESAGAVSASIDYEDNLLSTGGVSQTLHVGSDAGDANRIINQISIYH